MKRSARSVDRGLIDVTPEDLTRKLLPISAISRAISEICENELRYTMTYTCEGEGMVELSVPALGHGLSIFLKGIGRRTVLELEAFVDGEYFAVVCRSGEGLPTRRELAEVSIAMREAGFDLFLNGDVVILRTRLKSPTVLTLYAEGSVDIRTTLLLELYDYVNEYLQNDE